MAHSIRLELSQRSKTAWHLCRKSVSWHTITGRGWWHTGTSYYVPYIHGTGFRLPARWCAPVLAGEQEVPLPPAFDAYTTATLFANPCTPSS